MMIYLVHINANSWLRFLFLISWNSLFKKQILLVKKMIQWFASNIYQSRQFQGVFPLYMILVIWHKCLTYSVLVCSADLAKLIILQKIKVNIDNSYNTHQLLNKRDDEEHFIPFHSITKAKILVCNMLIAGKW